MVTGEEDLEQCSEAGAGLGACAEWAGPWLDNWLCAAVEGGRKLVTMTNSRGSKCVC